MKINQHYPRKVCYHNIKKNLFEKWHEILLMKKEKKMRVEYYYIQ